ncbi:MAG: hypothetical protein HC767_14810 [Akkermansiaceae bacterium]|nr:hypothetical protein [Akkermansiaceae bacterium]
MWKRSIAPWMVTGLLVISFLSSCSRSEFREPDRHGPPTLVVHAEKAQLWLLVEQEEMKSRNVGGGQRFGKHVTEVIYHFTSTSMMHKALSVFQKSIYSLSKKIVAVGAQKDTSSGKMEKSFGCF